MLPTVLQITINVIRYTGVAGAGKSIFGGLKEGVSGVWKQPARGAKVDKNKGVGALKGIGKGVLGVLIKPAVGVIDGATKLLNGVKNTTNVKERAGGNRLHTRCERMIYGPMSHIRPYNYEDSLVWGIISKLRTYEVHILPNEIYLDHVRIIEARLIMTDHRILKVSVLKKGDVPEVKWSLKWTDFGGAEKSQNGHMVKIRRLSHEIKKHSRRKKLRPYEIFCRPVHRRSTHAKSGGGQRHKDDYLGEAKRIQEKLSECYQMSFSS